MKSNLITRSGHDKLVAELQHLWREERPEITRKVNWAASLGDRSENADYQYNKQILRKIDRRVRYLGKRLEELRIVDFAPEQEGKVYFGAWVEIENELGMSPVNVETEDGTALAYNHADILRLRSGEMTEQEYAERNKLIP